MKLEMFINFNGNCREAVEFYAKVFRTEVGNIMTYGDAPPDPNHPTCEADRDRIMYAGIPVGGMVLMFMDTPSTHATTIGDNINPTISTDSKDEVTRLLNELSEGGEVIMELQQTFFSEWYGMVKDKFGVYWQILHYSPQQ
ncbi:MAG: VOC family protein [Oscillospiraceae bacterium]|nr:VOC family protein [Oscillospiraceae bacterium]